MAHPLDGSRAKIERAGDHLEALDAALARFVKNGGFSIASEVDPDTGEYVMRAYSDLQPAVPPPLSASVMVGDVVHNLRSALDHVVWQLAKAPSKDNQFPIFDTPEGFQKKGKRNLRSVPREHWAKVEAYQPYPGRNQVLSYLATLNDVDKHRLLLPGITVISPRSGRFSGSGVERMTIKGRDWADFEDGAEVYRITIEPSGSQVNVKAEVPYTILFRDPAGDVAATLQDLRIIRMSISNIVESFTEDFPA